MKIRDALGLDGAKPERITVPVRTWVPAAVVVAAMVIGILSLAGARAGWAVPVGIAVGSFLAIPIGTALTLRGR